MELDKLKQAHSQNTVVQAICDHMAARERNQNETKLHRILKHLANDGHDLKRSELIAAFRALEEAGCGQYVEGRHGWPSRFVWGVKSLHVSSAAKGQQTLEHDVSTDGVVEEPVEDNEMAEHSFVLRPDLTVSFDLPEDLTKGEAARLAAFLQTLPFDDDG